VTQTAHVRDVPPELTAEAPGVSIRWLIAQKSGAKNFAMRVIEVQPGAATPWHKHATEHETYVLQGKGILRTEKSETPVSKDHFAFVPPETLHQFVNSGKVSFRFICVVTMPKELH
jgi:quercetin dioxygenase-like cupin family protein